MIGSLRRWLGKKCILIPGLVIGLGKNKLTCAAKGMEFICSGRFMVIKRTPEEGYERRKVG